MDQTTSPPQSTSAPRITLCTAYFNRPRQWRTTLDSLLYWYGEASKDWLSLSIQDDSSTDPKACKEITARYPWRHTIEYVDRTDRAIRNPGVLFNRAVELAEGELLCLTNPECLHMGDILGWSREHTPQGLYRVFGCREAINAQVPFAAYMENPTGFVKNTVNGGWYQHSIKRNALLHFCSVMWKADYQRIGGFDPAFDEGYAFEDNDFVEKVLAPGSGLKVAVHDRPYVIHQWHERVVMDEPVMDAWNRNGNLLVSKWGHGPRFFVPAKMAGATA